MSFGEHDNGGGYGYVGDFDATIAERKAFQTVGAPKTDAAPEDSRLIESRERASAMTDREFIDHIARAALAGTWPGESELVQEHHAAGARTAIEWILNLHGERYPSIGDAAWREVRSDVLVEEFSKRLSDVVEEPNA